MKILFEDDYLAIVVKSAGVLSQAQGQDDIVSAIGGYIITRLDRPVGGLVLTAKTKEIAAELSEMLQQGLIKKTYIAVVEGEPQEERELISYIITDKRLNISKTVNKGMPKAKEARLSYNIISKNNGLTLIKIRLYTGRHHQIRVQLASDNTPIWGDTKYNQGFKHKRGVLPALFAYNLEFNHPVTGECICVKALPDYGKFLDFDLKEILK